MNKSSKLNYTALFSRRPQASAVIRGSVDYPTINGVVKFYQTGRGTVVVTQVSGLPTDDRICREKIFGFHIHSGNSCSGNASDPFANAQMHLNLKNCNHPYHMGDLPPLFGADGHAFSAVLTNRFSVRDVIGRTLIIHSDLDDFVTQPGGNSGTKIACGIITPYGMTR